MNALGLWLAGSIVHATIFAVVGIAAYLAIRRLGPAAGSLAAGSSLVIMALVSAVALSPWPRWWTWSIDRPAAPAVAAPLAAETSPVASEEGGPPAETPAKPKVEPSPAQPTFLSLLVEELKRPAVARPSRAWGWREWLAVGSLAGVLLGLARLGAGLFEVERLRTRSYPVNDPGLDDLIQVLRAELSCTRPVEMRESSDLTTPATIGWRRPVLLLPFDWRDWDEDERRAVLAHELRTCAAATSRRGSRRSSRWPCTSITPWRTGWPPGYDWSRSWRPTPGAPGSRAASPRTWRRWPGWPCAATAPPSPGRPAPSSPITAPSFGGSRC